MDENEKCSLKNSYVPKELAEIINKIPAFRYMLPPVMSVSNLYTNYDTKLEIGNYAYVYEENNFYVYQVSPDNFSCNEWIPITAYITEDNKLSLLNYIKSSSNDILDNSSDFKTFKQTTDDKIKNINENKASKEELANVVAGLVPMGSVSNLTELNVKPKRNNNAYYVEDQLSPAGNAYIYRWDTELNLWVNTKQVVFKDIITQGLGDSYNKVMSQKVVTDELALKIDKTSVKQIKGDSTTDLMSQKVVTDDLALKANHGYDSSPKTLKEVDDKLDFKLDVEVAERDLATKEELGVLRERVVFLSEVEYVALEEKDDSKYYYVYEEE